MSPLIKALAILPPPMKVIVSDEVGRVVFMEYSK
jgi:hypothetical protein